MKCVEILFQGDCTSDVSRSEVQMLNFNLNFTLNRPLVCYLSFGEKKCKKLLSLSLLYLFILFFILFFSENVFNSYYLVRKKKKTSDISRPTPIFLGPRYPRNPCPRLNPSRSVVFPCQVRLKQTPGEEKKKHTQAWKKCFFRMYTCLLC